jgi:hypothetical protein
MFLQRSVVSVRGSVLFGPWLGWLCVATAFELVLLVLAATTLQSIAPYLSGAQACKHRTLPSTHRDILGNVQTDTAADALSCVTRASPLEVLMPSTCSTIKSTACGMQRYLSSVACMQLHLATSLKSLIVHY